MKKFNLLITFVVLPVYWIRAIILKKWGTNEQVYAELLRYPKHYLGFRRIKIMAHGAQPDPTTPAIYISNHQSMNDIFVCFGSLNRQFGFIAKQELFTSFITGPFMRLSGSYSLDRDDARASLKTLKGALKDVEAGKSILAFPEGTRSQSKDMLEFKDGMFAIFRKGSAPIVPMYIKESFNEQQDTIHVYFDQAIEAAQYNKLKTKELSDLIFERMNALKNLAYSQ